MTAKTTVRIAVRMEAKNAAVLCKNVPRKPSAAIVPSPLAMIREATPTGFQRKSLS